MPEPELNQELSFSLKDIVDNQEVTPSNITVSMLHDFIDQVTKFLRGSRKVNVTDIKAEVKEGSLSVVVRAPNQVLDQVAQDYAVVADSGDLSTIDTVRRSVVEAWQAQAAQNEHRRYIISARGAAQSIEISSATSFTSEQAIWLDVEKYVYGKVYDMGGKTKSNVHISLENGASLTASSDSKLLATDKVNRLYQDQLLRIKAKQNLDTKQLTDESLVSFEEYDPKYDEAELDEIAARGRIAWSDVNSTTWVEELRGNIDG